MNTKILSKLDIIISNQKALENRVSKVEESVDKNNDSNQGDEEYIKKIIKEVAKKLLEASIYPTPDELREFTNNYMNENYDDFIKRFKRYDKWIIFYEKNIASPKKITSKDNYSYFDNDEIEAFQEAEETNKGVDEAAEVDEAEEVADEAEEVLQEEEENEIREEDEEEGRRIYISSTDEETKERMRRLKKQYKK
ncbi:unnamed protein product [Rhizophagus irregularis]|uniref:Uncharacterized protein n=1 Tax=Rhizophagus irregularis TaxID=588596 RepID=A0A915Z8V3_9GLOM|nr:unnamed protein product [Rhizophagus irregularis]